MTDQNPGWKKDFFGPPWAWILMAIGFLLMGSTFVLRSLGSEDARTFIPFVIGTLLVVTIMAYLVAEGRKAWPAWTWVFHLDDQDLIMGRKKNG